MSPTQTGIKVRLALLAITGSCTCDTEAYVRQTPALLVTAPDQIDFGAVPVGFDVTRTLTLLNTGQFPLHVDAMTVTPSAAPFDVEGSTFRVEPEQEVEVVVHFRPFEQVAAEAKIIIEHDAFNSEADTVTVVGEGASDTVCTACGGAPSECLDEDTQIVYEHIGGCEEDRCEYRATQVNCWCRGFRRSGRPGRPGRPG